MIAVFVNCIAIIIGSLIGIIFSKRISDNLSRVVQTGSGVVTMVIGIEMALAYENIIFLAMAIIAGGILGSWMDIDGKILLLGDALGKLVLRKKHSQGQQEQGSSNFAYGFLNASVLFCVGAMAIIGSINDGLNTDASVLLVKSTLDGISSIVLGATMGPGVIFAAIPVVLYQGSITLLAGVLSPVLQGELLRQICAVGYVLVACIGVNFMSSYHIKTANFLPALLVPPLWAAISALF